MNTVKLLYKRNPNGLPRHFADTRAASSRTLR